MQLMCDAVSVLGSRHGLLLNPVHKKCAIIRFDRFDRLPEFELRAGAVVGGREVLLPLCSAGVGAAGFDFHDQRISPCTMSVMGIDGRTATKVKLTAATPFRPRDAEFSTTPVIGLRLEAASLGGGFRWTKRESTPKEVEVFVEFAGPALTVTESAPDSVDLAFESVRSSTDAEGTTRGKPREERLRQIDRVVALSGERRGLRFTKRISLDGGGDRAGLDLAWCTHSGPVLSVAGKRVPFRYAAAFPDLTAVAGWARKNPAALFGNAARVDELVGRNNCPKSVNNLLAQTLHSWLVNTWWADVDGREWFSVWEGSCYYHSTVDVEYTQAPFYLAVWPELLGIELDWWPEHSKPGEGTLGARGAGTLFLSHDMGSHASAGGQDYPHEMEAEENANYVIMAYAHWRRTAERKAIEKHGATIEKYLEFLAAASSSGSGIPDQGVANTIDDASPAVQFGKSQVYLAVKALAAYRCGAQILAAIGRKAKARKFKALAAKVRAQVERKGWRGDHYATLLERRGVGLVDPWSGEKFDLEEIPGWDAPHIYTANGQAVLDMVGLDLGLKRSRLVADLEAATARCLREYGCVHTDFDNTRLVELEAMKGLAGISRNPGWISMNMLRDIAAFYRGVDLVGLAERYWDWQTVTNSQEPKLFFETFNGNNLCFYPRGVAVWGFFDALAGLVVDRVAKVERSRPAIPGVRVPRLLGADWRGGKCRMLGGRGGRAWRSRPAGSRRRG